MPKTKQPKSEILTRSLVVYLYADGSVKTAQKGDPRPFESGGLPVGSFSNQEQADRVIVAYCKLGYDNKTYRLPWPSRPRGTDEQEAAYADSVMQAREKRLPIPTPPVGTPEEQLRYEAECHKALVCAPHMFEEAQQLAADGVTGARFFAPLLAYRRMINDPMLDPGLAERLDAKIKLQESD